MKLTEMSAEELASFKAEVQKKYDDFKAQGLSLNMARGKPSAEQLDLTEGLLTAVKSSEDCFAEELNIPKGKTEFEVRREMEQIAETTVVLTVCLRLRHFLLLCSA